VLPGCSLIGCDSHQDLWSFAGDTPKRPSLERAGSMWRGLNSWSQPETIVCVYTSLPWPQSGRRQYEEIINKETPNIPF
jgi:hypothetical protein